ncbi:MAG: FkbM family methyltransferase [Bacteroidetes bacterium]|nr:FkbM family methyltransferase [Bacteroidota bacterium]
MINQFINQLPILDRIIFWAGKFFNKIGNWFLSYKDYKYWPSYYNKLADYKVNALSDGKFIQYYFKDLKIFTRIFSSDSLVFELVILKEEYKTPVDIFLLNNVPLNNFLDLGGNIGLTTLYVKKLFPDCHVVVLEPDEDNFLMAMKNFEANCLTNTTSIRGGVGKKDCYLVTDGGIRDKEEWAYTYKEVDTPTEIVSYSINTLLKEFTPGEVDFIKIDVEGAEKEIFSNEADISFLKKVKVLALEIHDEFDTRIKINNILKENNFIIFNSGETTIAAKRNLFQ